MILTFAEMLRSEPTVSLLASNATNYTRVPKYGYQRNPRYVGMALLFKIFIKTLLLKAWNINFAWPLCAYPQY